MTIGNLSMTVVQAFIGLIFLVGMVEAIVKFINYTVLKLDEKWEQVVGFVLSFILGFGVAMFADYNFLGYFDIDFQYNWMNWLTSGFIIGAGTGFLERKFDLINIIPHIASGVATSFRKSKPEDSPFTISEVNYKDKYGDLYNEIGNEEEIGGEKDE
jgi:hypothetical protein